MKSKTKPHLILYVWPTSKSSHPSFRESRERKANKHCQVYLIVTGVMGITPVFLFISFARAKETNQSKNTPEFFNAPKMRSDHSNNS